jgi:hypothetical protein
MAARRRPQLPLPGIEPGDEPIEIEIPTMDWEQIDGDMSPGTYGGTIATGDGRALELKKIQPVREYVGDEEAKDVGFPFWTREAYFTADDLDPSKKEVRSAMDSVGLDEDTLENLSPDRRAIALANAMLDYGDADEGPAGWSGDIGIPEKVRWWGGEVAGSEYLADEDEAFRDEVLGYGEIKQAIEEAVERMVDESEAQAWSALGDQMLSDLENAGYDPETAVCVAEFGEARAMNGDILIDRGWESALKLAKGKQRPELWNEIDIHKFEQWLEEDGYELTNFGGHVPSSEGYAAADHVVDAVARQLDRSTEDVEDAAKSLDWWQKEISRGTSGDTSVWAKRRK